MWGSLKTGLVLLTVGIAGLGFGQAVPDVPENHGLREAIREIQASGLLRGWEPRFRGPDPRTRAEFTVAIHATYQSLMLHPEQAVWKAEALQALVMLATAFDDDLRAMGMDAEALRLDVNRLWASLLQAEGDGLSAPAPASDLDLVSWQRLLRVGLVDDPDRGVLRAHRDPVPWRMTISLIVGTRSQRYWVERWEKFHAESPLGAEHERLRSSIAETRNWRFALGDLRKLALSRHTDLRQLGKDMDEFLGELSDLSRRFLTLSSRANGPFADIPKNHWASNAVDELRLAGILVGYPDLTFQGKLARGPIGAPADDIQSSPGPAR